MIPTVVGKLVFPTISWSIAKRRNGPGIWFNHPGPMVLTFHGLLAMRFMGMLRNFYGNWTRREKSLYWMFTKINPFI
jgi:hypothetical protein